MSVGPHNLAARLLPVDTLRQAMVAHRAGLVGEAEFYCRLAAATNKKAIRIDLLGCIRTFSADGLMSRIQAAPPEPENQSLLLVQAHLNLALVLQQSIVPGSAGKPR